MNQVYTFYILSLCTPKASGAVDEYGLAGGDDYELELLRESADRGLLDAQGLLAPYLPLLIVVLTQPTKYNV